MTTRATRIELVLKRYLVFWFVKQNKLKEPRQSGSKKHSFKQRKEERRQEQQLQLLVRWNSVSISDSTQENQQDNFCPLARLGFESDDNCCITTTTSTVDLDQEDAVATANLAGDLTNPRKTQGSTWARRQQRDHRTQPVRLGWSLSIAYYIAILNCVRVAGRHHTASSHKLLHTS